MKDKTRISVTLTPPFLDAMDELVNAGVYLNRGVIIREALRTLLAKYGIETFILTYEKAQVT